MAEIEARSLEQLRQLPRYIEKLQILLAERGESGHPQAAIRRAELTGILPGKTRTLLSRPIAAAPTQADYNNLQKDVATIFAMLVQITETLR